MLTQEVHDAIIATIRESGVHASVAAKACGVPNATFRDWIAKALDPNCKSPYKGRYCALLEAVEEAEAAVEAMQVRRVVAAGETTWQASAWFLERKHKDRWARADQIDVTSRGQGLFDALLRVDAERGEIVLESGAVAELPDKVPEDDE